MLSSKQFEGNEKKYSECRPCAIKHWHTHFLPTVYIQVITDCVYVNAHQDGHFDKTVCVFDCSDAITCEKNLNSTLHAVWEAAFCTMLRVCDSMWVLHQVLFCSLLHFNNSFLPSSTSRTLFSRSCMFLYRFNLSIVLSSPELIYKVW